MTRCIPGFGLEKQNSPKQLGSLQPGYFRQMLQTVVSLGRFFWDFCWNDSCLDAWLKFMVNVGYKYTIHGASGLEDWNNQRKNPIPDI